MSLRDPIIKQCHTCEFWEQQLSRFGRCINPCSCVYGVIMAAHQDCTLWVSKTKGTTPLKHKDKNEIKRVKTVLEWRRSGKK